MMDDSKTPLLAYGYLARRLRQLLIAPELLLSLLKPGHRHYTVDDTVPAEAHLAGMAFDADRNCIVLYIEHESFDEVREGQPIPVAPSASIYSYLTLECPECASSSGIRD